MRVCTRRHAAKSIVAGSLSLNLTGCIFFLRLFARGRLAGAMSRFGRRYQRGGRTYGPAAVAGTIGRPISYAHVPTVYRELARGKSIEIVAQPTQAQASTVGRVLARGNSVIIESVSGNVYIRSTAYSPRLIQHFDNRGIKIGEARFNRDWSEVTHRGPDGRLLGSDKLYPNRAVHFDQNGRHIGESRLVSYPEMAAFEWIASAGLVELFDFYAASLEFCDAVVINLYNEMRHAQELCLQGSAFDCDKLNVLYGALHQHLNSNRTC
jgi:hypothetical protein